MASPCLWIAPTSPSVGNILDNAARHAAQRVRIAAEPSGPAVIIEDDGPGIAADAHPSVVERGTRLDQREGGAGLGLAIVQDVLEAYGWQIALGNSDRLGGLKVTIAPAAPAAASPAT